MLQNIEGAIQQIVADPKGEHIIIQFGELFFAVVPVFHLF
jgi:hypothetical protein